MVHEKLRGQMQVDRFEFVNPKVQTAGEAGVLTFNLASWTGDSEKRWNCTEVYTRRNGQWRIIQTHWSFTGPPESWDARA
jgi:hypothetical protein